MRWVAKFRFDGSQCLHSAFDRVVNAVGGFEPGNIGDKVRRWLVVSVSASILLGGDMQSRLTQRTMASQLVWVLALLVSVVTQGCGSKAGFAPAPSAASSGDYSYLIGPGDTLNITVWRNPELSMAVPVRPDGKISTPLVQDLNAMGKDPKSLAKDIEHELAKYIRDPVVTVIVTNVVGSTSEQIRVVGEATRPQTLPFKYKMTLLDVMIAVGGLTEFADGNAASILRGSEGNKQYSVRLKDLVKRGDVSANVEMRPGDVVVIPQSWF